MSDQLTELFAEILEVNSGDLGEESSPDTVENWDSLSAMHLVSAIETTFSIKLSTREMMKMASIGLARNSLRQKGVDI
jgi:acyl carrier protein